jgi:AcrR family transcriptional regulator
MMIVIATPTTPSSRQRMIHSAALLFREQGIASTSFSDVIEHSGAPRGSIYHHFPGGKAQLAEETIRWAGASIGELVDRSASAGDPVRMVRDFVSLWRTGLQRSGFGAGCPVVAAAVESADELPGLAAVAGEQFDGWQASFAGCLRGAGVPRARAARLATLAIASIEGAIVLCRAAQDIAPLDRVGRELELVVRDALPAAS